MINKIRKLFPSYNEKEITKLLKRVERINTRERELKELSFAELFPKVSQLRLKLRNKNLTQEDEEEVLAYAKNACRRLAKDGIKVKNYYTGEEVSWNMIPYDVQLVGAMILNQGKIAEMKTGEGKTLVAALSLLTQAFKGEGCHLVTVNDYLAKRDGEEMSLLFNFFGLSTGILQHGQTSTQKREQYQADITYGTNSEFGFDYLKDNMCSSLKDKVQRGLKFAIIDEVDSILIDEARTPLIISEPGEESTDKYKTYNQIVKKLSEEKDYIIDRKKKTVSITEDGITKLETILGVDNIYTDKGFSTVYHLEQALKANTLFSKGKDYIVKEDEVILVDEFTGRLGIGRRLGKGLHQALEAKENVKVQKESITKASITYQNFFKIYSKFGGMTGTASTEAEEFGEIYGLDTIIVPTNREIQRKDLNDLVFISQEDKFNYLVEKVKEITLTGQPVLIGTSTIKTSEIVSNKFKKAGIKHKLLNAKNHEEESAIILDAGKKGSVTIATNMAGRGTDIKINQEVRELGGLYVIGSEKHESRRIDNQLRGRSGRQGDPGTSQFYLSLEDPLLKIFGDSKVQTLGGSLDDKSGDPLNSSLLTKIIGRAQKAIENHNFDIRKHVVKYDNIDNKHRERIYKLRDSLLESHIDIMIKDYIEATVTEIIEEEAIGSYNEWDYEEIHRRISSFFRSNKFLVEDVKRYTEKEKLKENLVKYISQAYEYQKEQDGVKELYTIEVQHFLLKILDELWTNHLTELSTLKEEVSLAGYGQRDPQMEYKQKAYNSFKDLVKNIRVHSLDLVFNTSFRTF